MSFVAAIAMEKAHKWNFALWKSWTERKERLFPMDPRETTQQVLKALPWGIAHMMHSLSECWCATTRCAVEVSIIEGSLEVKLPTIWTVEKQR